MAMNHGHAFNPLRVDKGYRMAFRRSTVDRVTNIEVLAESGEMTNSNESFTKEDGCSNWTHLRIHEELLSTIVESTVEHSRSAKKAVHNTRLPRISSTYIDVKKMTIYRTKWKFVVTNRNSHREIFTYLLNTINILMAYTDYTYYLKIDVRQQENTKPITTESGIKIIQQ